MTKNEFLKELKVKLKNLPESEIEKSLAFYSELIDDKIAEENLSESEAVLSLGEISLISAKIIAETPLKVLLQQKLKPKKKLTTAKIALLAAFSPILFPIALSLAIVAIVLYASFWIITVSTVISSFSFVIGIFLAILKLVISIAEQKLHYSLIYAGAIPLFAGLAILMFIVAIFLSKLMIKLSKNFILILKRKIAHS